MAFSRVFTAYDDVWSGVREGPVGRRPRCTSIHGLNLDPNVKEGILSYLSDFKPLKDITLEFEKPHVDLERKINGVSLSFQKYITMRISV